MWTREGKLGDLTYGFVVLGLVWDSGMWNQLT